MTKALIDRIKIGCFGLDPIDPLRLLLDEVIEALAQPEQEPLAWISTGPASMIHWTADKPAYGDDWVPLYTTPPQREFVGLTEDEAFACKGRDYFETYKAIEAKLKDKNT